MQLDYLLLADAAAAAEGKLYIHGAGWETIYVMTFPAVHPAIGVAARLRVAWEETNQPHSLEINVVKANEDGDSLLSEPLRADINLGRPANLAPGSDQFVPLALNITNLRFEEPGSYAVVLRMDGSVLASSPFDVTPLQGLPWPSHTPNP